MNRLTPGARVPVLNADGTMSRDWFQQLQKVQWTGPISLTANNGAIPPPAGSVGFITISIGGSNKKIPVYPE